MTDHEVTPPPERLAERVQIRTAFSTEWGAMIRFMIQLEYRLEGDWREVVRYHHDGDTPGGHDVTEEGIHRDAYREGEKYHTEHVSPPIPANEAFDYAEEDSRQKYERLIRRFEQWHGVVDGTDP